MRGLLATDGSPDALAATEWLARFPLPAAASIRIVSVTSLPAAPIELPGLEDFSEGMAAEARRICEEARAKFSAPVTVDVSVAEGDAREQLLKIAEDWPADLVVLGQRGLSGVERALLGSVSLAVARQAPCAVLVVKGVPKELRHIVIGIDGSEHSRHALRFVTLLPLPPQTDLWLVGVAENVRFPASAPGLIAGPLRSAIAQVEEENKAHHDRLLSEAEADINQKVRVRRQTMIGNPAEEIIRAAKAAPAALVVVGSRGLGAMKRLLLGSVSERVLVEAECSVLITKR